VCVDENLFFPTVVSVVAYIRAIEIISDILVVRAITMKFFRFVGR